MRFHGLRFELEFYSLFCVLFFLKFAKHKLSFVRFLKICIQFATDGRKFYLNAIMFSIELIKLSIERVKNN